MQEFRHLLVGGVRTNELLPVRVYYAFPRVRGRLALVAAGDSEGDIGVPRAMRFAALAAAHLDRPAS